MPINFKLSERLKNKLENDEGSDFANKVDVLVNSYSKFAQENEMCFFPEYTNHGIKHIERVLEIVDKLIPDKTFEKLTYQDVGVIIIAVVLHDIGMQTSDKLFKNMINGKYDKVRKLEFGDKSWNELWDIFLKESKYWNGTKKSDVLGDKNHNKVTVGIPDLKDSSIEKKYDIKLIGEFIRKYHHRLADDIASMDYIRNKVFKFNEKSEDQTLLECLNMAGLVARSHGMALRDTFDYLKKHYPGTRWSEPRNTHIVYLMVLLRIADLLDMKKDRTNKSEEEIKKMSSPLSRLEHEQHKAIWDVKYGGVKDKERIDVEVFLPEIENIHKVEEDLQKKENIKIYVKIKDYVNYIQNELDKSWAILGEVYQNEFALGYRRIVIDNLTDNVFEKKYELIPKQFRLRLNDDLAKLLIEPLYGDNPTFGVRELLQNAVDACRECMDKIPSVDVKLDTKKGIFTIIDKGKGMTLEEIEKYYLTIGSSYNDNIEWLRQRDEKEIYRTGRFGIGVLASFLIGDKIIVETRSRKKKESGYVFEISKSDKYVVIKKEEKLRYGTKITIKCKDTSLSKLIEDVINNKRDNKWYNWYIDENPVVNYFCDKQEIVPNSKDDLKGYRELKHKSKTFGVIRFRPTTLFLDLETRCNKSSYLYCNGFYITNFSHKMSFSNLYVNAYFPFGIPSLQITDRQNNLPINLNRTNIDKNIQYDFEEDLAKETCKDFICQLLAATNISVFFNNSKFHLFLIFGKDGYAFFNLYTRRKIKNKLVIYLKVRNLNEYLIGHFLSQWYTNNDTEQKYLFYFMGETYDSLSLPFQIYAYNDRESGEFVYELCSVKVLRDKYEGYKIKSTSSEHIDYLKKFIDFIKNTCSSFDIRFIGIAEIGSYNPGDAALDNVFESYMDKDPIIPYNFEKRKKKFKKIYNNVELSEIIKYHMNIIASYKTSLFKTSKCFPSNIYKKRECQEKFFQPEDNIDVVLIE